MPMRRHPVAVAKQQSQFASLPLDHALVVRLAASFGRLREHGLRLGEIFYAKLFAAAPHLRPLFREGPEKQAAKLIASLDIIVRNLTAPGENAAMLAALGRRHSAYGAKPEHYGLVVELLIDSMKELSGPSADEQTFDEWRTALTRVSRQMIAASASTSAAAPPTSPADSR